MSIQCVITGCALIEPGGRWIAGDLFDAGDVYLFNGNIEPTERGAPVTPAWMSTRQHYTKTLTPSDWWEKRGVFVIRKDDAGLSEAALNYLSEVS